MKAHVLIDRMDEMPAVNELVCSCGKPIHPDCDVSTASINEAFEAHLASVSRRRLGTVRLSEAQRASVRRLLALAPVARRQ